MKQSSLVEIGESNPINTNEKAVTYLEIKLASSCKRIVAIQIKLARVRPYIDLYIRSPFGPIC